MLEGVTKAVENRVQMQQEFSSLYKNNHKHEVLIGNAILLLYFNVLFTIHHISTGLDSYSLVRIRLGMS